MRAPCSQAVLQVLVVHAAQARRTTPPHSSLQAFSAAPLGQGAPDALKEVMCEILLAWFER
jgi:hypothetical protein